MVEKNRELSHGGRHSKMTCIQWDKNQLISTGEHRGIVANADDNVLCNIF